MILHRFLGKSVVFHKGADCCYTIRLTAADDIWWQIRRRTPVSVAGASSCVQQNNAPSPMTGALHAEWHRAITLNKEPACMAPYVARMLIPGWDITGAVTRDRGHLASGTPGPANHEGSITPGWQHSSIVIIPAPHWLSDQIHAHAQQYSIAPINRWALLYCHIIKWLTYIYYCTCAK